MNARRPALITATLVAALALWGLPEAGQAPNTGPVSVISHAPTGSGGSGPEPSARLGSGQLDAPLQAEGEPDGRIAGILEDRRSQLSGYHADRVLVVAEPDVLEALALRHGLRVLRPPSNSGIASLELSAGQSPAGVLEALRADPDVASAFRSGRIYGAAKTAKTLADYQWHTSLVSESKQVLPAVSGLVVAVLDSGVAYETYSDVSGSYVVAPSLSSTPVVAPYDFVNADAHANDDHQHGTHIASLILSDGAIKGIAPGATLMPIKVLDEHNAGDELSLIDGIHHAVDHGADVINMSLSFGTGYHPSEALQLALERAHDAGIVLVGAAGNAGEARVTWPAASPRVIAVGAVSVDDMGNATIPAYSNLGAVEVLAPGGAPGVDANADGYDDGVLAETFSVRDPLAMGYWFLPGTSQAAAQVSGAALQLLAAGATPQQARIALQSGASTSKLKIVPFEGGTGAGVLDLVTSLDQVALGTVPTVPELHVSVLPYLIDHTDGVRPRALLQVVDGAGAPAAGVTVHGLASGSTQERFACTTDAAGQCVANLAVTSDVDGEGQPVALAWAWQVELVESGGVGIHPGGLVFASEGLEVLSAALASEPVAADGLLTIHWPAGHDPELGTLAEAYTVPNYGTGLLSSPMGVTLNPRAITQAATTQLSLDLNGTGLLSSPMGVAQLRYVSLDLGGMGLLSSPLGLTQLNLSVLGGTGLLSSPLGVHALSLFRPTPVSLSGTGLLSSPLSYSGRAIQLTTGDGLGFSLVGSSLGDTLAAGGWTVDGTTAGASAVVASGLLGTVEITTTQSLPSLLQLGGSSLWGVQLDPASLVLEPAVVR